jgi:hypothetical protein
MELIEYVFSLIDLLLMRTLPVYLAFISKSIKHSNSFNFLLIPADLNVNPNDLSVLSAFIYSKAAYIDSTFGLVVIMLFTFMAALIVYIYSLNFRIEFF